VAAGVVRNEAKNVSVSYFLHTEGKNDQTGWFVTDNINIHEDTRIEGRKTANPLIGKKLSASQELVTSRKNGISLSKERQEREDQTG